MTNAVFLHKSDSPYDDDPVSRYDFPDRYLYAVRETVGDWIVYYRPGRTNAQCYFAVAQVEKVIPNPKTDGHHLAIMVPGTFLALDTDVPRTREDGQPYEVALTAPDGRLQTHGGRRTEAVRLMSNAEFAAILNHGLPVDLAAKDEAQWTGVEEMAEAQMPFERPVVERLTRRAYRDVAFRRKVRAAYGNRCAISGLRLSNGGGRPEVQAAHIRSVEHGGPDTVRNGIALSGTLHCMFDRGLIGVAPDHTILVSHNKVDVETARRLFVPDMRLTLPADARDHPHADYLEWHRMHCYGR